MRNCCIFTVTAFLLCSCAGIMSVEKALSPLSLDAPVYRVNCGEDTVYRDFKGYVWKPDRIYDENAGYGNLNYAWETTSVRYNLPIKNTSRRKIYQTESWGSPHYRFNVENGRYTILLHFAETFEGITEPGKRQFDVFMESEKALAGFDPIRESGLHAKAIIKYFPDVKVEDGALDIEFIPTRQQAIINAIEVFRQ